MDAHEDVSRGSLPDARSGKAHHTDRQHTFHNCALTRWKADPKTGATWSGRGREPLWIKGKKRERFQIVG